MKKRSSFVRIIAIILLIVLPLALFACKNEPVNDDGYVLIICGLVDEDGNALADVSVTKAQIKELFASKPVTYTDDNPVYASDKTDDQGNRIPHTLKGVYLEDVLALYTQSAAIDAYGSMILNGADGYVTLATEEVFNVAGRGSKMIIAIEYDGTVLSPNEKSGALRAIFPDQIANCWAKKLNKIEFSTDILQTPTVLSFSLIEAIEASYTSYAGRATLGGEEVDCTYFGYSIADLIEDGILNAQATDKMHCSAWDYNSDTDTSSQYSAWTKYDVYSGGWLLLERQISGQDKEAMTRAPVFDGPDFSLGMTVKNILALSVFNTAVVSFQTAFDRFDKDGEGEFFIKDLLIHLNMFDEDNSYRITPVSGQAVELTASQIFAATVTKEGSQYILSYNGGEVNIASVSIII